MSERPDDLPSGAGDVARAYPAIWKAYSALGEEFAQAGPINRKAVRLVKLALAIGASSEGAVHSHARRAMEEGSRRRKSSRSRSPTLGFPQAVRVLTWIEDITDNGKS